MKIGTMMKAAALAGLMAAGAGTAAAQDKYTGEVFATTASYCPNDSLEANGAQVQIMNYQALYSLLGTTYGGNGTSTFNLPDLRGRTVVGVGTGVGLTSITPGQAVGQESVTLSVANLPSHTHALSLQGTATISTLTAGTAQVYTSSGFSSATPTAISSTKPGSISAPVTVTGTAQPTGESAPFSVRDPALGLRYCIVTSGIYPPRP